MAAPPNEPADQNAAEDDERRRRILARIRNGAWLDAQHFAPLQWTVPGLIPEGFGLIVGPPKIGKSWFVLGIGLAAAVGGPALGRIPTTQRPVFYAALEDGHRRMQDRARQLTIGEPIPPAFEYVTEATPDEILPLIEAWLDLHPDGLVMLDTLGKVMPRSLPGEGVYQRDYRIGGVLKRLTGTHPGSTLLVVHHKKKGVAADWMDSTSGTNGLNGSADFTLLLERTRGETDALLRITGRDVTEGEYAVTAEGGHWTLDGDTLAAASDAARDVQAAAGLGDTNARIVDFITRHPAGVGPSEVAAALDMEPAHVRVYLRRLIDQHRIVSPTRGRYMPVTSVTPLLVTSDHPNPTVRGWGNQVTQVTP